MRCQKRKKHLEPVKLGKGRLLTSLSPGAQCGRTTHYYGKRVEVLVRSQDSRGETGPREFLTLNQRVERPNPQNVSFQMSRYSCGPFSANFEVHVLYFSTFLLSESQAFSWGPLSNFKYVLYACSSTTDTLPL